MTQFGDFQPLCTNVPSYPWCNLFYRQLLRNNTHLLLPISNNTLTAPVGVNPTCGILRVGAVVSGTTTSLGNIANVAACGLSIVFTMYLIWRCERRKAAVGRIELRLLLSTYLILLPIQLITTGSLLSQGSTPLVVFTAIHAGLLVALFWVLLANGVVATQVVEDGTMSSLVPTILPALLLFALTTYLSLDTALGITSLIGGVSDPPLAIRSVPLFVLTSMWPAIAIVAYLSLMAHVTLNVLREMKPMWFYILSMVLFVLAQLAWFLLGGRICSGSNKTIDGSFIATMFESAALGALVLAWKSITEDSWDDDDSSPGAFY